MQGSIVTYKRILFGQHGDARAYHTNVYLLRLVKTLC